MSQNTSALLPDASVLTIAVPESPPLPETRPASSLGGHSDLQTLESTVSFTTLDDDSTQQMSTTRLFVAHLGAAMTLFLATTDATIVSTSLPTITSELSATQTQYTWVGVAYMLTQTAFQPLYGLISDLVGRKSLLFTSIVIFAIGSLLCGLARDITMLIASRALAGIGGGGIVSSVWVLTSEIVQVRNRTKWSQALSITWSCSAVAGPLLGGLFSGGSNAVNSLSWRWAFILNLPICFLGSIVLAFSLRGINLRRSPKVSWSILWQRFDFGGLFLFMAGTSVIVVGFSFATDQGWNKPSTYGLVITGVFVLIIGALYEQKTKRDPLFPPTVFQNLTVIIILLIVFLHNFAFSAGTFYLALFYQLANGYTPLEAGLRVLPYSLGSSLASIPAAWFIGSWQQRSKDTSGQNFVISAGLLSSTLGFGLLILLNERTSMVTQIVFPLIAGIGLGLLFHAPYQVFFRALKPSELATGTSAFFLVRFTGATIGLAVAGAVYHAKLSATLPSNLPAQISAISIVDFNQISSLVPQTERPELLRSISRSIQTVWILCSPCLGLAALISLLLRRLSTEDTPQTDEKAEKCC